ncbi:suppressor of los1-1 [Ascosphaera acerosa]|nr:suppressor of los1-1 [Ascosphaera acerosa]
MAPTGPQLCSFAQPEALEDSLREYTIKAQDEAISRHGRFRVAISGGSLPTTLGHALLREPEAEDAHPPPPKKWEVRSDALRFGLWDVFFADERCVGLGHAESNSRLVKEELVERIPDEAGQPTVHSINDSLVPESGAVGMDAAQQIADLYQNDINAAFNGEDDPRRPCFDLMLLGCGPDGHTCSLFPGHPLLDEAGAWVAPIVDSPKPPPARITLTLPVVTHAKHIAFVAQGAGKRDVLQRIFDTEEGKALPSALVNAGAGERVTWFVDEAAVQGLEYPRTSQ